MNIEKRELKIVQVTDNDALMAACRLRYIVFTLEQGDERYANHDNQTFNDPWDDCRSMIFNAVSASQEVIGTLRLVERRKGPYIGEEGMRFDLIKSLDGGNNLAILNQVGILTRGVVLKPYRSWGVFTKLCDAAEEYAINEGIRYMFGVVESGNEKSRTFFQRGGYTFYAQYASPAWNGFCMFKDIAR